MGTTSLDKEALEAKRQKEVDEIADIITEKGFLTMGVRFSAGDPEKTIDQLSMALRHWMRDKFTKTEKRPTKMEMRLNLVFED